MPAEQLYIAIDLGAGSGRVFLAGFAPDELFLEEARRFVYPPRPIAGHLRWDLRLILREITEGLRAAAHRARALHRPIASIGVDSWGVDYGLVDIDGLPLEDPVCYRDARTGGTMDRVFAIVPRAEIFARTGIQFLPFNTLYQLWAHAEEGIPPRAAHLLLMPDLLASLLTGRVGAEYTNATTTQMMSTSGGTWDIELLERLGLPVHLLPEIVQPGHTVGTLSAPVAADTGLGRVPVCAVATHDTGSAVAGTPLEAGWAYISSGTWSLVGVERGMPLVSRLVERQNFTNEGGAFGTTRFLKNVMGLWILESCRREWNANGQDSDHDRLLAAARSIDSPAAVIFPDDQRFLNPDSMLAAIARQLDETGQPLPGTPAGVARMILDSLALRYASVLRRIEALTGSPVRGVRIVGGGSRNSYLNEATAAHCGVPVVAGPVEATVIGNALVQAVTAGRFASLAEARRHVAVHTASKICAPQPSAPGERLEARYADVESRYSPDPGV